MANLLQRAARTAGYGLLRVSGIKRDGFGTIKSGDTIFSPSQPQTVALANGNASAFFSSIVQIALDVLINSDTAYRTNREMAVQMTRDIMLMQPLERRMMAVSGQEWKVEASPDASPYEHQVAARIDVLIRRSSRVVDLFKALSWAVWRGLGAAEVYWGNEGTEYFPTKYKIINGDKITFSEWGEPRILTRQYQYGGRQLSQEELSRVILHQWEPDDGDFYEGQQADYIYRGRGLRDRCWAYWWLRQNAIKMWVQFIERKGTGWVIGRYPQGNADAQAVMEQILQNLLSNSKIAMPVPPGAAEEQYGIENVPIQGAGESVSMFKEFVEDFAARYLRIYIQGEDQANQTGGDGLGSGRATALQSMFKMLTDYDSSVLEQTISSQLVQRMVQYNYSVAAPSVRLRFLRESLDYNQIKLQLETAKEIGLPIPKSYAQKSLGIPSAGEGEEVLQTQMQAPAATGERMPWEN